MFPPWALKPVLGEYVSCSDLDRAVALYLEGSTVKQARGITSPPITTYSFYKRLEELGHTQRGRISRRQVVAQDTLLTCQCCNKERPASSFSEHPSTKSGYDLSRCKTCKKAKNDWTKVSPEKKMFNRAKHRASVKGIEFAITLEDIRLPEVCPVFKRPFIYGDHSWTYSIDRLDSSKGYIPGNIAIISNKANMMKNTATAEEVRQLYEWLNSL